MGLAAGLENAPKVGRSGKENGVEMFGHMQQLRQLQQPNPHAGQAAATQERACNVLGVGQRCPNLLCTAALPAAGGAVQTMRVRALPTRAATATFLTLLISARAAGIDGEPKLSALLISTEKCALHRCWLPAPPGAQLTPTGSHTPSPRPVSGCDCESLSLSSSPVCDADGLTYANACVARCQGARIVRDSECSAPCEFLHAALAVCPDARGTSS